MRKSHLLAISLIFLVTSLFAQNKILVSVSPEIGTEVDREERDKYNWFPDVPNFISARFFQLPDETYEIQIRFFQNGQVTEQNRVITEEAFHEKYQATLITQEIKEEQEFKPRRRSNAVKAHQKQMVNIRFKNTEVKNVLITGLEGDSVSVEKTRYISGGLKVIRTNYSVEKIENLSVISNTNVGATLGIGVAPGAIAALFHYNFAENNYHRDERARNIFYLGEIIGLSVSGTVAAMKSVDYDYVFTDLSYEQKKEKLNQFINRGIRRKTNVRFSPWVGAYHFPNYLNNTIFFPGLRLSICFNPRQRMEIMYGYSDGWSLQNKDFSLNRRGNVRKYTTFNLLKIGFRTDYTYHQNFNPFMAWGWGLLGKRYKTLYDYDESYYHYDDDETNPDIILSIELGLEHHFNRLISIETRIGVVENIDYGIHYMGQFSLHFGPFY